MAEAEVERERVRMRAVVRQLPVEAVARLQRDLVSRLHRRHGLEVGVPPVVGFRGGDPHRSSATSLGRAGRGRHVVVGPAPRAAELVQRDDSSQAAVVEDRRDDLGGEAAIGVEHPLERLIVVSRAAVVLDDLASLLHSSTTGCVRRSTVRSSRSEPTPSRESLVRDGERIVAGHVLAERDSARARLLEQPLQDVRDRRHSPKRLRKTTTPAAHAQESQEHTARRRHGRGADPGRADPYEPFRLSQGFRVGDLLFISGQAAIDEQGQVVGAGDFDAQAEQTFSNLRRVLEAGGSSLDRVVKVTIFLTDMANFPKVVDLRGKWFSHPYPADTIVEVTSLALPELEIEIEAIAVGGD